MQKFPKNSESPPRFEAGLLKEARDVIGGTIHFHCHGRTGAYEKTIPRQESGSVIMRTISLSVSRMATLPRRPKFWMVLSTPLRTSPSPA